MASAFRTSAITIFMYEDLSCNDAIMRRDRSYTEALLSLIFSLEVVDKCLSYCEMGDRWLVIQQGMNFQEWTQSNYTFPKET